MNTWKTKCKVCGCDAFHREYRLVMEMKLFNTMQSSTETRHKKTERKIVKVACDGIISGKHECNYTFPDDFKKI